MEYLKDKFSLRYGTKKYSENWERTFGKKPKFKVGDKFRFAAPMGSYGVLTHIRTNGPFKDDPVYYATYYYGLDVKGRPMTESSGLLSEWDLELVSEEEFQKIATQEGFGD